MHGNGSVKGKDSSSICSLHVQLITTMLALACCFTANAIGNT